MLQKQPQPALYLHFQANSLILRVLLLLIIEISWVCVVTILELGGAFAGSLLLGELILIMIVRIVSIITQLLVPAFRNILNYRGFPIQIVLIITIIFHSFLVVAVIISLFVIVILRLILLVVLISCKLVESVTIFSVVVV